MAGLNKFDEKLKREQRRRNHIARDLRTPKDRQRVIPNKDARDQFFRDEYNEEMD